MFGMLLPQLPVILDDSPIFAVCYRLFGVKIERHIQMNLWIHLGVVKRQDDDDDSPELPAWSQT